MPQGNAQFVCTDSQGQKFPMNSNYPWSILFRNLHSQPRSNEFNSKLNRWEFFKWKVNYAERFAEKTWNNTVDIISESTSMVLYHLPKR